MTVIRDSNMSCSSPDTCPRINHVAQYREIHLPRHVPTTPNLIDYAARTSRDQKRPPHATASPSFRDRNCASSIFLFPNQVAKCCHAGVCLRCRPRQPFSSVAVNRIKLSSSSSGRIAICPPRLRDWRALARTPASRSHSIADKSDQKHDTDSRREPQATMVERRIMSHPKLSNGI